MNVKRHPRFEHESITGAQCACLVRSTGRCRRRLLRGRRYSPGAVTVLSTTVRQSIAEAAAQLESSDAASMLSPENYGQGTSNAKFMFVTRATVQKWSSGITLRSAGWRNLNSIDSRWKILLFASWRWFQKERLFCSSRIMFVYFVESNLTYGNLEYATNDSGLNFLRAICRFQQRLTKYID